MAEKVDCFAFTKTIRGTCGCAVLTKMFCANGECRFYKTIEQVEAERNRSKERHAALGLDFKEKYGDV